MHTPHAYSEAFFSGFHGALSGDASIEKQAFAFWGNMFRAGVRGAAKVNQSAYKATNQAFQDMGRKAWQAAGAPTTGHQGGFANMWDIGKQMYNTGSQAMKAGNPGGVWDTAKSVASTGKAMLSTMSPQQIAATRNATLATGAMGAAGLGTGAAFVF